MNEQDNAAMEVWCEPYEEERWFLSTTDEVADAVRLTYAAAIEYRDSLTCEWGNFSNATSYHENYTTACGRHEIDRVPNYCPNCGRRVEVTK